jgi:hypothetical protein
MCGYKPVINPFSSGYTLLLTLQYLELSFLALQKLLLLLLLFRYLQLVIFLRNPKISDP